LIYSLKPMNSNIPNPPSASRQIEKNLWSFYDFPADYGL
jgi:hypothetical protein